MASVIVGGVWTLLGFVKFTQERYFFKTLFMATTAIIFWALEMVLRKFGPSDNWWDGFLCFGIPVFGMACFATGGVLASLVKMPPKTNSGISALVRRQMMPVFLLHVPVILMITWVARAVGSYQHLTDSDGSILLAVVGVVGAIILGEAMRAFMPRITCVFFGGR